jgi:RNA polymerase sigma factor (sigma-70 family)
LLRQNRRYHQGEAKAFPCNGLSLYGKWQLTRAAGDQEDVALEAFESWWDGQRHGRYPNLFNRNDLWALLASITVHKAQKLIEHETAQGRDIRRRQGETALAAGAESSPAGGFEQVLSKEPSPKLAVEVNDLAKSVLAQLSGDARRVFQWRLEGYTRKEIADKLGMSVRHVDRQISAIRNICAKESEK